MATTEVSSRAHDRHSRRRPFSAWMKRLANLKTSSSNAGSSGISLSKRHASTTAKTASAAVKQKNNPYPESGFLAPRRPASANGHLSFSTSASPRSGSDSSLGRGRVSARSSAEMDEPATNTVGAASGTPTIVTDAGTHRSDAAHSAAAASLVTETNVTVGGAMSSHGGGGGSTFSSPAPSLRSLTTTLTTIQSTAPSAMLPAGVAGAAGAYSVGSVPAVPSAGGVHQPQHGAQAVHGEAVANQQGLTFSHQFPTSPPPSALPSHLAPQAAGGHPTTYVTATANNLLSDNASILTLASSSKRRRRRSIDTDASVRALAPSSLWGGSRESLPLSVLSGNVGTAGGGDSASVAASTAHQGRPSLSGMTNPERASVYSSSGVAPALTSERNSYYANKQGWTIDGGSVKSGRLGHGRNDSISGSIGAASSPLASPRENAAPGPLGGPPGRLSRRSSGRVELGDDGVRAHDDDGATTTVSDKGKGKEVLAGREERP